MKFLLVGINSKFIHTNQAIRSLYAYAEGATVTSDEHISDYTEGITVADNEPLSRHVECVEYTINQQLEQIFSDIYEKKPDVIGFSCYIWNITTIRSLIPVLKKILPNTDIWLGGPEVNGMANKIPAGVRGIMQGEGERIFLRVLKAYVSGTQSELPHIVRESECLNMDELPFPYYNMPLPENRIVYYESSRGCPFRCSYCLSSIEKAVRFRSIELVKKELKFFLDKKVRQVKFVDRTFNIDHARTLEIWRFLKENDNGITNFHFEISADLLNEEELTLLEKVRPGAFQLETGVQTTNPDTLDAIHRHASFDKIKENTLKINGFHNIHQHLDLIAGLPFENYESFGHSFDNVYALQPDQLQLGFLKLLSGSEMAERAEEFGIVCSDNPPYEVLYTNWLSFDDVLKLKGIEQVLELYYNSSQYRHTLEQLQKAFPRPFVMYERLAAFFKEHGYNDTSKRRLDYYDILLEFACENDAGNTALYKELLTLDCYLRENIKSRPSFAGKDEIPREEFDRIYREAEARGDFSAYGNLPLRTLEHMTHLEFFTLPKPHYILFDYKEKDPISFECRTISFDLVDNLNKT